MFLQMQLIIGKMSARSQENMAMYLIKHSKLVLIGIMSRMSMYIHAEILMNHTDIDLQI